MHATGMLRKPEAVRQENCKGKDAFEAFQSPESRGRCTVRKAGTRSLNEPLATTIRAGQDVSKSNWCELEAETANIGRMQRVP